VDDLAATLIRQYADDPEELDRLMETVRAAVLLAQVEDARTS
jgi:hypothetical protein